MRLSFVFFAASAISALGGEPISPLADVIALPEFKVVSDRPLPPREEWHYVKLGNFEVLSSTSERVTKEFVRDLREFQIVLSAVAPRMKIQAELPVMVVLCGRSGDFARFAAKPAIRSTRGRATSLVRDHEIASIILDYQVQPFAQEIAMMSNLPRNSRGDLRQTDQLLFLSPREVHTSEEFIRQYIHLSLSQFTTRPPAWFAEGIANIYSNIEYNNKWIQIGLPKSFRNEFTSSFSSTNVTTFQNLSSSYPGGDGYDSYLSAMTPTFPTVYEQPLPIMSMERLLAVDYDSALLTGSSKDAGDPMLSNWRKQTTAFVHLCLYGRQGRYLQGFLKFVTGTSERPATEAFFKECFGMSYRDMAFELRSYSEFTDYKSTVYEAVKGDNILLPAPPIAVRPATDGEIGRIKGESLRLAGQDEAARNEFIVAYLRGDRDSQLLASLGLMARQRHDDGRAKTYLEAVGANATPIPRPRAYLELGRLRFAQYQAANRGAALDATQLAEVLGPLFAAVKLPQQLSGVYLEIAHAWENTSVTPQRDHIGALEQGIRFFPRHGELIVRTAALLIKHGYKNDAAPLIMHALEATRDPELKTQLERLNKEIGGGSADRGTTD